MNEMILVLSRMNGNDYKYETRCNNIKKAKEWAKIQYFWHTEKLYYYVNITNNNSFFTPIKINIKDNSAKYTKYKSFSIYTNKDSFIVKPYWEHYFSKLNVKDYEDLARIFLDTEIHCGYTEGIIFFKRPISMVIIKKLLDYEIESGNIE